tara:strand:+ start:3101 stop:3784 length:684 start_codon:yes stop_codon:yes gene_type:complete
MNTQPKTMELGDDMDRVRSRMAALKLMQKAVNPVDEYNITMNEMVQAKKRDVPGLSEHIMALRDGSAIDQALFSYIADLERMHNSIWCTRCDMLKCVQYAPETAASQYGEQVSELMREGSTVGANLRNLKQEFIYRIEEQERINATLIKTVQELRDEITNNTSGARVATVKPTHSAVAAVPAAVPATATDDRVYAPSDTKTITSQFPAIPELFDVNVDSTSSDSLLM